MAKALLVLHVGETCRECDLFGDGGSGPYCKRTDFKLFEPDKPGRPIWCPARPLPYKANENEAEDVLHKAAYMGWNSCVDFLGGKAYETWPHKSEK